MASADPSPSAAAAAEAASDLNYLLQPLHWTAVMRHPSGAASSPFWFRLYTFAMLSLDLSFVCSTLIVLFREGTADMDVFTLTLSVADTNGTWLFRLAHTVMCERAFHQLADQVGHDFAEFLTWDDIPLLRAQCRVVRRFTLTYIWFGVGACAYFLVSPVCAEGLPYVLALPFDAMQPLGFAAAWVFCMVTCLHTVVMTMVLDSLNSENVALAAYDAATLLQECPLSIKRSLLLLMHRAQRPLCITASGFFPLSRESFVAVVNVSYSFFAILRNFKKEEE
ncbi:uncharacterized protein LOC126195628 [Schistocerca nitens]|uniref:uncharacterized protein LOC126195628 n=1 Tax=Schistocerca nitens TaxID=7011 RepID=UPI002118AD7E|nr:uncharacterized protein LOC126195628 [Schistocerca nitens]